MGRIGLGIGVIALGLAVAPAAQAASYQATAVTDGGTISGTITYSGTPPPLKTTKPNKDQQKCDTDVPDETLMVGANKGIKNVVVRITDIKKGKKWDPKAVLDQRKCQFRPHVTVAQAGVDVEILNSDGILHNIHTYSTANPSINVAQPGFLKTIKKKFDRPEIFKFTCDAHGWMNGVLVVLDHPYVAVTDEKGTFKLTDVPPGDYEGGDLARDPREDGENGEGGRQGRDQVGPHLPSEAVGYPERGTPRSGRKIGLRGRGHRNYNSRGVGPSYLSRGTRLSTFPRDPHDVKRTGRPLCSDSGTFPRTSPPTGPTSISCSASSTG